MQFVQFGISHRVPVPQPARIRILLVDDATRLREALARDLRRRGCDVQTEANGLEGLHRLAYGEFDLVVSDIQMPGMDGLSFRRRALERDPSLRHRFLLCSAMPAELLADPDIHFLQKPFTAGALWATLTRLLRARSDQPSATEAEER